MLLKTISWLATSAWIASLWFTENPMSLILLTKCSMTIKRFTWLSLKVVDKIVIRKRHVISASKDSVRNPSAVVFEKDEKCMANLMSLVAAKLRRVAFVEARTPKTRL